MLSTGVMFLALLSALPAADTTIVVPAGARLDVNSQGGQIVVRSWDRDEVRIRASYERRDRIIVTTTGSVVRVRAERERGGPASVDFEISAPAGMDLDLTGVSTDISIEDSRARVQANSVQGSLTLRGGVGQVNLSTVQGSIDVEASSADLQVSAVNGSIRLHDIDGDVQASAVSGSVSLRSIRSERVDASSVSGRIFFEGQIQRGGRYSLESHSGDVIIAAPEPLNATLSISTFSGSFITSIPLTLTDDDHGDHRTLIAGDGDATIDAKSFSGDVRLIRSGEESP